MDWLPKVRPNTPASFTFHCLTHRGDCRGCAGLFSDALKPRHECLVWVTEHGIFPSSENLHLYYRLRQSYGDHRLLREAPGHLFLDYEDADLVSFLQLGIVHGWDMHVLPQLAYGGMDAARVFVCHDEWIGLRHRQEAVISEWRETLQQAGYPYELKTKNG